MQKNVQQKSARRTRAKTNEPTPAVIQPPPLGPFTIDNRIAIALQPLALLEWALAARCDDANEVEVFLGPLLEAKRILQGLADEIRAHGVACEHCDAERAGAA